MQRKNIIVVIENWTNTKEIKEPEVYGNFKKMCDAKGFPYHSLKSLKFPISFKYFIIYKVEFK